MENGFLNNTQMYSPCLFWGGGGGEGVGGGVLKIPEMSKGRKVCSTLIKEQQVKSCLKVLLPEWTATY